MDVVVGARGSVERVVGEDDTAAALGSGSLAVLGTPRLLAWCEAATCAAVEAGLGEGETSVGVRVELDHLAASAVATAVVVRAEVTATEGRRVVLDVEARDGGGTVVGRGTVERVVVDADRFLARLG
ncbi:thioesterase family protein [Oryzobacter telluris]|uniref:thioesterase family protein n=1 Tax=Oryzobacter telluris TaxID=3149179 RepID=UPI00370DB2C3